MPTENDPGPRPHPEARAACVREPEGPSRPDSAAGAFGGLAAATRVDEHGRIDALATVGGVRGIVEASLPTFVFMVWFLVTSQVFASGVAAVAVAVVMGLVRVIQRQSPAQAVAGLAVVVLCVFMALRTGQARDFYVWGFVTNAGYSAAFIASIVARWPLMGVLFGLVRGEGTAWRRNEVRRRAYALATWVIVAVMLLRLAVQVPLYLAEAATALGAARLVMGLPLYALGLWLAWSVSAPRDASASREPGTSSARS